MHRAVLSCAFLVLLVHPFPATAATIPELNTMMMRSTFKIEGGGTTGTSFILCREESTNHWRFILVTADHVLAEIKGDKATLLMRKKKASSSYERYPFDITIRSNGVPLWVKHPEADVAVLYIPIPTDADIELVPTVQLATDSFYEQFDIHPGDKLHALGFPFGAESDDSGFPILRSGAIASFPLTPTHQTKTFLFDFQVFRGNSGGPVYFYERNRLIKDKFPTTFDGAVIMGLVIQEKNVTETIQSLYEKRDQVHPLNVAVVVHASLISETIDMLATNKAIPAPQPAAPEKH